MRTLLALDDSPESGATAAAFASWASTNACEVRLFSVVRPGSVRKAKGAAKPELAPTPAGLSDCVVTREFSFSAPADGTALSRAVDAREQYLRQIAEAYLPGLTTSIQVEVDEGVNEALAREARRWKPDIVAMGTRARSGWVQALFGSNHELAIHRLPVPVMVFGPAANAASERVKTPRPGAVRASAGT